VRLTYPSTKMCMQLSGAHVRLPAAAEGAGRIAGCKDERTNRRPRVRWMDSAHRARMSVNARKAASA
jgi:hypothetical protein